jgi:predicted ATPase
MFMAPPWPEIYAGDGERRHSFEDASAEYGRLASAYPALGYDVVLLPKLSVRERADYVLSSLG